MPILVKTTVDRASRPSALRHLAGSARAWLSALWVSRPEIHVDRSWDHDNDLSVATSTPMPGASTLVSAVGTNTPLRDHSQKGVLYLVEPGADDRNRTRNLLFTKQLLCRLSYVGRSGDISAVRRSGG